MQSTTWGMCPTYTTHYPSLVAGVTYANRDGSSRQEIIQRCQPGEQVFLIAEPDNAVDPHAVAVQREDGAQLGYLPWELAERVAGLLRQGYGYAAFVAEILEPGPTYSGYGLRLRIFEASPDKSPEEVQEYIDAVQAQPAQGPSAWPQPAASEDR